jgi:hypothetical protein
MQGARREQSTRVAIMTPSALMTLCVDVCWCHICLLILRRSTEHKLNCMIYLGLPYLCARPHSSKMGHHTQAVERAREPKSSTFRFKAFTRAL